MASPAEQQAPGTAVAAELAEVRAQLREATETIEAIRRGGVDSLVIGPPGQEQVYSLTSADRTYRLLVQTMNEGAATVSPRGVILDANQRLAAMSGRPVTGLVGTPVLDLATAPSRDELARLLDLGAGDGSRGEIELSRPGGAAVPALLAASAFSLDGMMVRCLILTDLTAQRAAEQEAATAREEIRAAAAYNRNLIEASPDPLIMIGPDGAITDVNTAAERATGQPRAGLLGQDFSGLFTDPSRARAGYEEAFRDGSIRDYALDLRHRGGHATPVLYNASVYRDPSGRPLGVFAAVRDVTGIRRTEGALRESEARLRTVFDNAPAGMYDLTPSGEFARVNPRFCEITGYSAEELVALPVRSIVHPDDLDLDLADTARMLAGEISSYTVVKRYLRRGGGVVWAEVNRAMVRAPDGSPRLIVGVVRDLTAQREAEAQLRALTAELEARVEQRTDQLLRANENLRAFTYSVSHDLRAPLRALSGFSEALADEYSGRLDEAGLGYLHRIMAASERMAALIDDLLQLSRVSRAEISLEPVDLSADVAEIAAELAAGSPGRQVRFRIQPGVRALADRVLIRTVLQNLIENAWKFTARRDGALIEFGTTAAGAGGSGAGGSGAGGTAGAGSGTRICCYVRDNGAGFDPAYAGKLFQPFQRLHAAADFPGTGIGLASARQIVERHGGRIWAEGTEGDGAAFYITLDAAGSP